MILGKDALALNVVATGIPQQLGESRSAAPQGVLDAGPGQDRDFSGAAPPAQ